MNKIVLSGYIIVPASELSVVMAEMERHIASTRMEEGCIVFEITQDMENSNRFTVYEEFSSQQAFDLHQERVRNSRWGEVSRNVQRYYEVKKVSSENIPVNPIKDT